MRKLALILVLCLVVSAFSCVHAETAWSVTATQIQPDSREVEVILPGMERLTNNYHGDRVKLIFRMSLERDVYQEAEFLVGLDEFDENNSFTVELPYFGKWVLTAEYMTGDVIIKRESNIPLALSATEVNIITGTATTDTLIEALKWFTGDGAVNTGIPTIVNLNRYRAFDWDNLPENMYRNPLETAAQNESAQNYNDLIKHLTSYVKMLLEVNPEMRFNFYVNDFHLYTLGSMCYSNKIPDGQYTVTMVTDGSASYTSFKAAYASENAQAAHEKLIEEAKAYKEGARSGQITDFTVKSGDALHSLIYAMMDMEEADGNPVRWWVVRRSGDTFGLEDADFQAKVMADTRISNNYINNLLAAMSAAGNDEAFKALYKFDDEIFETERQQGKKLMMFLGTSGSIEKAIPVMDYVKFLVACFGDEYAYFYKGHPGNYQVELEQNKKPYTDIGVHVLDASIAAELFIYFNPDIYVSGYESSLFINMGENGQDVALVRRTREVASADINLGAYADMMGIFIADMTATQDPFTFNSDSPTADVNGMSVNYTNQPAKEAYEPAQAALEAALKAVPAEEANDHLYLVEFDTSKGYEYAFAIWNADKEVIHYLTGSIEEGLAVAE
jgi:hypothetical protein